MENIGKLKEKLDRVHDYLYVQTLGKVGEDALFELNDALGIVENLLIQRVSQRSEPLIDIHGYHGDLNGSCLTCGLPEGCHEL